MSALLLAKQIEKDLRTLAAEARRNHPMIKEEAERSIVKLRAEIAGILRAMREEKAERVDRPLRVNEDLLRPFVLACSMSSIDTGAKIVALSITTIQRALQQGCLPKPLYPMVVRVLRIQALSHDMDILLKILQSLPLMLLPSQAAKDDGGCIPEEALRRHCHLFRLAVTQ